MTVVETHTCHLKPEQVPVEVKAYLRVSHSDGRMIVAHE